MGITNGKVNLDITDHNIEQSLDHIRSLFSQVDDSTLLNMAEYTGHGYNTDKDHAHKLFQGLFDAQPSVFISMLYVHTAHEIKRRMT